ncbi:cysteine desulfurase NifS [Geobacter sp. AOG1]|uniref:cysteine desulfurase NifS n=1 Tax=Geobacter sp. AOG1 TaxID=1566346 RepID=UPI001CC5C01B|nr:cysteine desulfurase NifS [Geobacter sp. AOG1]GFE57910.1 cysteine desulfurase [Geobacter sp. AOG1]
MELIYMDYNATTPVKPAVLEALLPFYRQQFGNPSSIHWAGRQVRGAVDEARERVAALAGCEPVEVVFTSCGTEADNMAIKGTAAARRGEGNHIITSRVEHPAVLNTCLALEQLGYDITRLEVDRHGRPDLDALTAAITDSTILISLMFANNETGTLFPVREIAALAAERRVCFHCDAVQAFGKVPVDVRGIGIGLTSISGHKLGAPKGVGALVVRTGTKLHPLLNGGSQERNRRAGTENVAGIVAFGKACELAGAELAGEAKRMATLRDRLERGIGERIPHTQVNGHPTERLPNTTNISFRDVAADSLLLNLDMAGVAVSSGSACASGTLKPSHVLAAMNLESAYAKGSVRFSLGAESTEEDVEQVLALLPPIVERLRNL